MRAIAKDLWQAATLFPGFAWAMLWQSSLLISVILVSDFVLRRKVRPAVRYMLWLLVLVKMMLPPSLALPTGVAWWLRPSNLRIEPTRTTTMQVHFSESPLRQGSPDTGIPEPSHTGPVLKPQSWLMFVSIIGTLALLGWILRRWRYVALAAKCAAPAPLELQRLLERASDSILIKHSVRLGMTDKTSSPVVFGFIRPVILLPASLRQHVSELQLRGVLLHELIHLRRGDLWVNCAQTCLQMLYWWHPLLWLANARIRQVREEAVDDAVMCALRDESDAYPQTLLEVAKLALGKPLSSLALVGILETRQALRRRIERLVNLTSQPKGGLTLAPVLSLLAFSAMALPMGQAPVKLPEASAIPNNAGFDDWPDPRFSGYAEVTLSARFLIVESSSLELFLPAFAAVPGPLVVDSNEVSQLERRLAQADAQSFPRNEALTFAQFSGGRFHYRVGGVSGNAVDYQTQTRSNGSTFVAGAECSFYVGTRPDWVPIDFTVVPWTDQGSIFCEIQSGVADSPDSSLNAQVRIPPRGAMLWLVRGRTSPGKSQLVLLRDGKPGTEPEESAATSPPQSPELKDKANELVQQAKALFETGNLDKSEALLHQALRVDARNNAAYYYLHLISQTQAKSKQGDVRVRRLAGTNVVFATATPQTILAELERIRLNEISFDHLPLAEVLRKLNDEVSPVVTFRLSDASPGNVQLGNIPITILPSLVDVRLRDVIDVIVRVSNPPVRYSVESNGVVFAAADTQSKPLYTRIIKVDYRAFMAALSKANGNADLSAAGASSKALRELLLKQGVDLRPPSTLFLNGDGRLLVHATLEQLARIERTVAELNNQPDQLTIKTRFLRLPDSMTRDLWNAMGAMKTDETNFSKILTPAQTSVLLRALNTKDHYLINEASVTMLSGRQAQVECVEVKTILSNNVPIQISLGPSIELTPVEGPDRWKIGLKTVASLKELLSQDDSPPPPLQDSKVPPKSTWLPHIRIKQISAHGTVPDGYTLILANPFDEKGEFAEKPGSSESHYVVLVTPTLIDSAGNRLHTDAEIESLCR